MARKRRLQSDSEDEQEDMETHAQDDLESSCPKKKRVSSAKDEDDTENMEEDEMDCSYAPEFPVSTSEAEVGIIEKITLVNFMCHTMLEVPLGANVNFIIGRNGSGKSAIMTALVVGLGGKAATTNCGNYLKGFIKDKCSFAQVSIKIRNRGQDAYRPKEYGDCITVERTINSDGSDSYKFKAKDGRLVSQTKDDLYQILDQFNIQVDTAALSLFDQDTRRNMYLNSSNPKVNYKFFLRATQPEQMNSDYQLINEQQDIIKKTLDKKQETFPAMQHHVQQLEEKYKDIAQLKKRVEELKKERLWAEVIDAEKKLCPLAREVKNQKAKLPRYEEKVQICQNQQHEIEVKIETQEDQKKQYETRLRELQDVIRKAEREHENMKKLVREKTEEANQFCKRVNTRRTVKSIETEIIQETRRIPTEENNKSKLQNIKRDYFEAKTRCDGVLESMTNLKRYSKRLKTMMERSPNNPKRFNRYNHYIGIRAKFFFQMMLSQRGYNGKMVFDHGEESLGLQVNVESGTKRVAKDTRSLSGGERSFSTVSFIMALWEAMESPFRCLDEFDVFMDMVNRRISMEMMLKVAKEQQERQFILLTPQDMSAIGSSRSVRIYKLSDPERGQTTLNFQAAES